MSNDTTNTGSISSLVRREWPHWVILGALFAASIAVWSRVPEQIPMHWNIRGEVDGTGGRLEGLLLLPMIALGNVMGKVRPNYFVGIRTPWTLASARSWEKTHRVGGRLFVVAGIALALASIIGRPEALVAVGVFGAASIAWLFYYSFAVWRDDTERVPVTGTRPGGAEDH